MQQAEVRGLFAKALYLANDSGACDAAGEALQSARQTGDLALIARALFEYARTGIEEGRSERVEAAAAECNRMLQLPGGSQEPMIFYAKAFCDYYSFEVERAEASLLRAIEILDGSHHPSQLSLFYTGLGACKFCKLQLDEAQQALTIAFALASKVGDDSRASLISNARSSPEHVRGAFDEALRFSLESIEQGKRALNQPGLVQTYLNLAELHTLMGKHEKGIEVFHEAEALMEKSQKWWSRVSFNLLGASLALINSNTPLAIEYVSVADKISRGRERAVQDASVLQKFRVFRAMHESGPEEALSIADEAKRWFRRRNPLYYYNALIASAWAERTTTGKSSAETLQELKWFDDLPVKGRRTLSVLQGFLSA
jgi:tetratricopeptide (TPR) repeat protein